MLLLDEPFGALDAKVRAELREWLRRLHDEVHVTTLLVTHDQEEAMSIADNIAVMDNARIEQVGGPRELYDRPANRFVMGFLGPVAQLDGTLVRPHDIAISPDPEAGGREAQVHRVSHLGFEVRVELLLEQGEPVFAQLTRTEAEELDLTPGDIVWLRTPAGARRSSPSFTSSLIDRARSTIRRDGVIRTFARAALLVVCGRREGRGGDECVVSAYRPLLRV